MRSLQQFWSVRRIGEDRVTLARLGKLRLWLARAEKEWGCTAHYGEEDELMDFAQVPEDVVPQELDWSYLLFRDAPRDYVFEAMMPDRPVIVRATQCIGIPGGESCHLCFTIPVNVRIRILSDGAKQDLATIPSVRMKQGWFGSLVDGILCYANAEPMVLKKEELKVRPNDVLVALEILNKSPKTLLLDKVCLDLTAAGLFCGNCNLYSSQLQLEYHDHPKDCILKYKKVASGLEKELLEVHSSVGQEKHDFDHRIISCCQAS